MMPTASCYPWFEAIWHAWLLRVSQKKLSHAYLLTGVAGLGKHSLLAQMAASVLCHEQTQAPCGQCNACHWLSVQTHPDYLIAEKMGSIGIDLVRQWREICYQTPAVGQYKVMVLPDCERLTVPAANALLKILEEPPESCIWLLSSSRSAELPATLLSRCQRLICPPVSLEQGEKWLQEHCPAQAASLRQQALQSVSGAPLAAQQWLQTESSAQRGLFYQQLQQYLDKKISSHVVYQSLWPSLQDHLPRFLLAWVVDMIRAQQLGESAILNTEYAGLIQQTSARMRQQILWQWYDQLLILKQQAIYHVNFGYWFLQWLLQLDKECHCE